MKHYYNVGRTLRWGVKDISQQNMDGLRNGEMFTLLAPDGEPHSLIMRGLRGEMRIADWNEIGQAIAIYGRGIAEESWLGDIGKSVEKPTSAQDAKSKE